MRIEIPWTKTQIHRSSAVRQTDLWLVAWTLFSGGAFWAALLAERFPGALGWSRVHILALVALLLGGLLFLALLRLLFLRDDFRFVTDGESYFFLSSRRGALLVRRGELRGFRAEEAGLRLETAGRPVLVEAPIQALILAENLLARWSLLDGHPQDPPHTPPYAR